MKRWDGKSDHLVGLRESPEALYTKADQTLPRLRGLASQKTTRRRRGIFLDFPFYRTYREVEREHWVKNVTRCLSEL
jgi:hypothetical protein